MLTLEMSEVLLVLVAPTSLLPPESIGSTAEPKRRKFYNVHDAHHTYLFTHGAFSIFDDELCMPTLLELNLPAIIIA